MLESTISATQSQQLIASFWSYISPFITPLVLVGGIWFLLERVFKLGSLHTEFKTVVTDLKDLKRKSDAVISNLNVICANLVIKTGLEAKLLQSMSPVKLTSKGEDLVKKAGFDQLYIKGKQKFLKEVKEKKSGSLSDLDDTTLEIINNMHNSNSLGNLKEIAFENGISLEVLLKILSIYLRDEVAKELLPKTKST